MSAPSLPRLHVVTDDAVLATPDFQARAAMLFDALGPDIALHLRSRELSGRAFHELTVRLAGMALSSGALLLVNDRVDLALAARAGAQVTVQSIPVRDARRLLAHAPLGYSAHTPDEALLAQVEGADFVLLGTTYRSASHPERAPAGLELVRRTAARLRIPVIAIGGITPPRVAEVCAAGARGVAVVSGIWQASDPLAAARAYLAAFTAGVPMEQGRS